MERIVVAPGAALPPPLGVLVVEEADVEEEEASASYEAQGAWLVVQGSVGLRFDAASRGLMALPAPSDASLWAPFLAPAFFGDPCVPLAVTVAYEGVEAILWVEARVELAVAAPADGDPYFRLDGDDSSVPDPQGAAFAFFLAALPENTTPLGARWASPPVLEVVAAPPPVPPPGAVPPQALLPDGVCPLAPATTNASFCVLDDNQDNSNNNSSLLAASCDVCIPGFFLLLLDLSLSCAPCPGGTFAAGYGATACDACPAGLATPKGALAQTACQPCPADTALGPDDVCTPCGVLQTAPAGATACGCVEGAALDYHGDACVPCPPGLFQPLRGARPAACAQCPAFLTSLNAGASACTTCLPGAAAACAACAAGTYASAMDAPACTPCAPGTYYSAWGATACLACAAGTVQASDGGSACAACAAGTFASAVGSTACTPCARGAYASLAAWAACLPCAVGTFQTAEGATACAACPALTTTLAAGATRCVCAAGAAPDFLGAACAPCFPGFFKPAAGAAPCGMCAVSSDTNDELFATSLAPGATACTDCVPGAYSLLSNSSSSSSSRMLCAPCPQGTAQPDYNAAACAACAPGAYAPGSGYAACLACPPDTYLPDAGGTACLGCPPHMDTPAAGGATACVCDSGWAYNRFVDACTVCPPGAVQTRGVCAACPPGKYAGDIGEGLACVPCARDTFAPAAGGTACVNCPAFFVGTPQAQACACAPGATPDFVELVCVPCPRGMYVVPGGPSSSGISQCTPCPAGAYADTLMASACTPCPNGTDAPFAGSTACLRCDAMVSADRTACHCPPGTFNASTAAAAADPDNTTTSWACRPCVADCGAGRYIGTPCAFDADAVCADCSPADGCPAGMFLAENCSATADRVCWTCRDGCLQGYYVASPCTRWADLRCARCSGGCGVGYYLAAPCGYDADAVCAPCPLGAYSLGGVTACTECPSGAVASALGCVGCGAQGRLADAERRACVEACPPGEYPSASDACAACPDGTYSPDGALCLACLGCVAANRTACAPCGHPAVCLLPPSA